MSKQKKIKFTKDFIENQEVATYKKLNELADKIEDIKDIAKGEQGLKGDKGEKGEKGQDGKNGKDGYTPIKNIDYFDGKDGRDGEDGSPDTPQQIADKLNTLNEKVEIKVIKGLEKKLEKRIVEKSVKQVIKEIPKQPYKSGGGASFHTDLNDMPDTTGENTDHDTRYVAKVQADEPTANPLPYEGQFWYDTDEDGGALPYTVNLKTKTANHTADDTDYVLLMDTTSGALTLALPTAVGIAGRVYVIMNIGQATNNVTIDPDGTETINTNLTIDILDLDSVRIISDGSNWWII